MSDPFEAPEDDVFHHTRNDLQLWVRQSVAVVVGVMAGLVGLVTVGAVVLDLVLAAGSGGRGLGALLCGSVFRTLCGGAVTLFLAWGSAYLWDPVANAPKSIALAELRNIVVEHQLVDPGVGPGVYADVSPEELLDVWQHIDVDAAPDRYRALVAAILAAVQ